MTVWTGEEIELTKTKLVELAVEKLQEISLKAKEVDVKENETVA